jgi:hypothetical protein
MVCVTAYEEAPATSGDLVSARIVFGGTGAVDTRLRINVDDARPTAEPHWCGTVLDAADVYRRLAGQHLLVTSSTYTPSELRAAGLTFDSVEHALVFDSCRTPTEYAAVLSLRHEAYSAVGKADPLASPYVMADRFDHRAIILVALHGDKIVGTARLALPDPTEGTEYDEFVAIPPWVDRHSLAVLSRIATHPSYRGSDLLYSLTLRCIAEAQGQGRRVVLGGCSDALLRVYERVGAQTTGLRFSHGSLAGNPEQLIVFRSDDILSGRGVRPNFSRLLEVAQRAVRGVQYSADGRP